MLIEFKVGNFLSFKDIQTLRMAQVLDDGQRGTSYGEPSDRMFIYGANGSGKSNLIKAMVFARDIILCGKSDISASTFKNKSGYSYFEYIIEIECTTYSYGFEINPKTLKPKSEWLYILRKDGNECLYEEEMDISVNEERRIEGGSLNIEVEDQYHMFVHEKNFIFIPYLRFIRKGHKFYDHASRLIEWFSQSLFIENSRMCNEIIPVSTDFCSNLGRKLSFFDTGISGIIEVPFINTDIPRNLVRYISNNNLLERDGNYLVIVIGGDFKRYWVIHATNENGDLNYAEVRFVHENGHETTLEDESLGTLRILQILALYSMMERNRSLDRDGVVVADELECSVHSQIMRKFIELFDEMSERGQLIATTHRADILRCSSVKEEEISFIDNDRPNGDGSRLYTLSSFDRRFELNERHRAYLDGRMAAVPVLRVIRFGE